MAIAHHIYLPSGSERPDVTTGSVMFIGTATTLIRYGGFTILTDPNFLHRGEKVHLGYGLHSTRRTDPAMEIEQLPPLDLVVLSHLHDDHFDRVAQQKLDRSVPIVTNGHAATALKGMGFRSVHPLKTWQRQTFVKGHTVLHATSMPGQHTPLRIMKPALPPVMGTMLELQDRSAGTTGQRIYLSGDTLVHGDLREIPRRYPQIDLAMFHLGGTRVFGLTLTMDAKQGVEALQIIAPDTAIPIHYNDYEAFKSPLEDFRRAVKAAGLEKKVCYLAHGETYTFTVGNQA